MLEQLNAGRDMCCMQAAVVSREGNTHNDVALHVDDNPVAAKLVHGHELCALSHHVMIWKSTSTLYSPGTKAAQRENDLNLA